MKKGQFFRLLQVVVCLSLTTPMQAQGSEEPEPLGLPGDNLDLYAVLDLFQKSKTIEEFETTLNKEETRINNLDLNLDEKVDFIKVTTKQDKKDFQFILQVDVTEKETQDVAVILVSKDDKDKVSMQIVGDKDLYGKDYVIEPAGNSPAVTPNPGYQGNESVPEAKPATTQVVVVESAPIVQYVYSPAYVPYYPPYYYGFYPGYFVAFSCMAFSSYHYHNYHYHHGYHGGHGGNVIIHNENNFNNYNRERNTSNTVVNNNRNGNYGSGNRANTNRPTAGNSASSRPSASTGASAGTRPSTTPAKGTSSSAKPSTTPSKGTSASTRPSTTPSKGTSASTRPSTTPSTSPSTRPSSSPSSSYSRSSSASRPSTGGGGGSYRGGGGGGRRR